MTFYNECLPTISVPESDTKVPVHLPTSTLLQSTNPWLLSRYIPVAVGSDGNCLLRSLSFALFGTEETHVLLHLLCVIEVLRNRAFYDTVHAKFYAPYKANPWLKLPSFEQFVCSLVKLGSYCDMLPVLAASSVLQKSIQTLWPLFIKPGELSAIHKIDHRAGGRALSAPCTYTVDSVLVHRWCPRYKSFCTTA